MSEILPTKMNFSAQTTITQPFYIISEIGNVVRLTLNYEVTQLPNHTTNTLGDIICIFPPSEEKGILLGETKCIPLGTPEILGKEIVYTFTSIAKIMVFQMPKGTIFHYSEMDCFIKEVKFT